MNNTTSEGPYDDPRLEGLGAVQPDVEADAHDSGVDGDDDEPRRINKRDFIRTVAKRAGLQIKDAEAFYEAFVATLMEYVRDGVQVNLTGFGRFYWQRHRGHAVQFGVGKKDDYTVMKFSATRGSNEFLGLDDDRVQVTRVPGTTRTVSGEPATASLD